AKRVWQSVQAQRLNQPPQNRAPEETVQFCWNGLRLAAEKSSKSAHLTLHYVYNSGSYNPLARIESFDHPEKQTADIAYYHVALNGLPEELTDSQGRIIWHGDYSLWGKLRRETRPVPGFRGQQNLRFQGQYFDRETGLHYNTFRYYAPDTGRFTQQDPIGLLGGLNLYQYAPNPVGWVDPWGWAEFDVDSYENLRAAVKGGNTGLDAHHAGQKAIMADLVAGYDPKTAPAILVSKSGHTVSKEGVGIVSRSKINSSTGLPFKNARELLARDIRELRRVYSDVPNSALKELIAKNKEMYPEMRKTNNKMIKGC
ncbi:TPA: RHS domain-containing protein, partial [Morganella morganii]|nr:RHS domain-containing protein [Morganella morganii]